MVSEVKDFDDVDDVGGDVGDIGDDGGRLSEPYPAKKEVMNHLMFHKSIVDQERNGERIDDYIDMIEDIDDGGINISNDDFECAIASVFKLVIDEKMDPWNIDLASFTKMYLKEAKKKDRINFIVAGQLVNMAWSVLKMQCEAVLENAEEEERENDVVEDNFFGQWDTFDYDMYEDPEDVDYEEEVKVGENPPIEKAIRREHKKPVSLIQLVDAFEEARNEAKYREKQERIRKEKCEERVRLKEENKNNYDTNAHKEDIHHDISMIWERVCWYDKDEINFDMIHDGRTSDFVTAFMSVLFLHKDKKVRVKQNSLPDGKIKVENLIPEDERPEGMIKFISETNNENLPVEDVITV